MSLGACALLEGNDPRDLLEFSAVAAVRGDTVQYGLVALNPSDTTVRLSLDVCLHALALRVYETRSAGGRLRGEYWLQHPDRAR